MSVEIEIVEDPARACAAMMVGAAADGGHVVLAGGSTPRAANEEFVAAVKARGPRPERDDVLAWRRPRRAAGR